MSYRYPYRYHLVLFCELKDNFIFFFFPRRHVGTIQSRQSHLFKNYLSTSHLITKNKKRVLQPPLAERPGEFKAKIALKNNRAELIVDVVVVLFIFNTTEDRGSYGTTNCQILHFRTT